MSADLRWATSGLASSRSARLRGPDLALISSGSSAIGFTDVSTWHGFRHSCVRRAWCIEIVLQVNNARRAPLPSGAAPLSSEWPVCPIAETTAPRRMGAALTYARRYALFTLVGITGEDDLDAPELGAGGNPDPRAGLDVQTSTKPMADEPPFAPSGASRKGKVIRAPRIVLATDQSEAVRDRLVAELADLKSADDAADWVHKNLAAKNTLIPADADAVEAGFREKLATIEGASAAWPANAVAIRHRRKILSLRLGSQLSLRLKVQSQSSRQLPRTTLASGAVALQRKPFACATRGTVSLSRPSPALCAAARRPRPITFGLLSPVLSAERLAMNTQSRSAGCTTGIFTVTAMKPRGGPGSASIPCRSRSNFGGDRD